SSYLFPCLHLIHTAPYHRLRRPVFIDQPCLRRMLLPPLQTLPQQRFSPDHQRSALSFHPLPSPPLPQHIHVPWRQLHQTEVLIPLQRFPQLFPPYSFSHQHYLFPCHQRQQQTAHRQIKAQRRLHRRSFSFLHPIRLLRPLQVIAQPLLRHHHPFRLPRRPRRVDHIDQRFSPIPLPPATLFPFLTPLSLTPVPLPPASSPPLASTPPRFSSASPPTPPPPSTRPQPQSLPFIPPQSSARSRLRHHHSDPRILQHILHSLP